MITMRYIKRRKTHKTQQNRVIINQSINAGNRRIRG